jgi:hypothetical protein
LPEVPEGIVVEVICVVQEESLKNFPLTELLERLMVLGCEPPGVDTFPFASWLWTVIAGEHWLIATVNGAVMNANFVALPAVILNVLLVAPVRPLADAVSV